MRGHVYPRACSCLFLECSRRSDLLTVSPGDCHSRRSRQSVRILCSFDAVMSTQTTMTSMTFRTSSSSFLNGSSRLTETQHEEEELATFWRRIRLNERTFSLSLLALSLSIVLGKLCVNYGGPLSSQTGNRYSVPSTFTQMYDRIPSVSDFPKFDVKRFSDSERFVNASNEYAGAAANVLVTFYGQYWWFLHAIMCGLFVTSFTWFIIYKDSSIPGVNPPAPFSPPRHRIYGYAEGRRRIQINYLLGMLNGILFFIYMCL